MSRKATNEYIGVRRRAYADAKPEKRKIILDDVCDTTGYSRKYANRLLTGSRRFKERKGRGPTYTERDKAVLVRMWREVGCPCTTYFRANVGEWLREYRTCVAHVPEDVAAHLEAVGRGHEEVRSDGIVHVNGVTSSNIGCQGIVERITVVAHNLNNSTCFLIVFCLVEIPSSLWVQLVVIVLM